MGGLASPVSAPPPVSPSSRAQVSVEKFHELRHATAAALHAMNIAEPRVAAARDVRARQQQRAERERTASLANS